MSTLAAHFVIIVGLGQYQAAISYGSGFSIRRRQSWAWKYPRNAIGTIFCWQRRFAFCC